MVRTISLFDNFEKIINVTRILERYIGGVGENLLRTRISGSCTEPQCESSLELLQINMQFFQHYEIP